jgi:hypothetical protein
MRYLIAFLTMSLGVASYQGTNPPDHATNTGNTNEQGKKEVKPLTAIPPTTTANPPCTQFSKPNEGYEQTDTNNSGNIFAHSVPYLTAASTVIVTIFTILIWLVYRAMLHATKINERAWIVPVVAPIEPTESPEEFQVKVDLRNNGKTPAWITAAGSCGKGATEQQPLPTKPPYTEMKPFSKKGTLLSPSGSFTQGFLLTKERLDHVHAGKSQLFIFGYAAYRDVYGDPHIVRYSFEARKSQDANHPHPLEFYVGGPSGYIDAD